MKIFNSIRKPVCKPTQKFRDTKEELLIKSTLMDYEIAHDCFNDSELDDDSYINYCEICGNDVSHWEE